MQKSKFGTCVSKNFFVEADGMKKHVLSYCYTGDIPLPIEMMRNVLYVLFDRYRAWGRNSELYITFNKIYELCNFQMDKFYKRRKEYRNICAAINQLVSDEYIKIPSEKNIKEYTANELIIIQFDDWELSKTDGGSVNEPFVYVSDDAFNMLASVKQNRLPELLHMYLFALHFTPNRAQHDSVEERPRYFCKTYDTITKETGLSRNMVGECMRALIDIGLIHYRKLDKRLWDSGYARVYTTVKDNWQMELLYGAEQFTVSYVEYNDTKIVETSRTGFREIADEYIKAGA